MRYLLLLVVVVLVANILAAQPNDGFALRLNVSYGAAWARGTVPALTLDSVIPNCDCPNYTDYSGTYASTSIGAGLTLLKIMHVGVDFAVQSHLMRQTIPGDTLPSLDAEGNIILTRIENEGSIRLFDVAPRLFMGVYLPATFYIELGVSALVNITNRAASVARMPVGVSWNDIDVDEPRETFENGRALMLYDQTLIDFPNVRFDVDVNLGKSFVMGDLTVQLLATYRHGLTDLTTMQSLRTSSLAGTLAFLYHL